MIEYCAQISFTNIFMYLFYSENDHQKESSGIYQLLGEAAGTFQNRQRTATCYCYSILHLARTLENLLEQLEIMYIIDSIRQNNTSYYLAKLSTIASTIYARLARSFGQTNQNLVREASASYNGSNHSVQHFCTVFSVLLIKGHLPVD